MIVKSPRITEPERIALEQKRFRHPGVGQYNLDKKKKIPMGNSNKEPRTFLSEELMYLSKISPGYVTKNYKHVDKKSKA